MWPKVSFVIPTLNAAKVLQPCLESISNQDYPVSQVEIIVADGGSTDSTVVIAKEYNTIVIPNELKTGEAGKAVGLKAATGDYIALIDSDNILPTPNWLKQMIKPLLDNPEAVGSEPWEFLYRKKDGFIDRYCALLGMNDPICLFIGNYDRVNSLTGKWTNVRRTERDMGDYLYLIFNSRGVPTLGANGAVFRAPFLKNAVTSDYLFDIDILAEEIQRNGKVNFIKVKNSIIHLYSGSNIFKFIRKQKRRITDLMYYRNLGARSYNWAYQTKGISLFILGTLLVFPVCIQSVIGFSRKPDLAWFFHPVACWIGLVINTLGVLSIGSIAQVHSRSGWSQ